MEPLEARTERYLQEAERVRVAAERARDPENRIVLLDVAHQYMKRPQQCLRSCGATDSRKQKPRR